MTTRENHGIQFSTCPECDIPIGQRGLARHRMQAHGVAPATKGRKPKPLTIGQAFSLRQAVADGSIPTDAIAFGSLLKLGFVAADGAVTPAGIARLA